MKKALIISSILLVSGIVNAATSIPLTGGVIQPKGTLKIDLKALVAQAPYQVTCTISVPAAGANSSEIMPTYQTPGPINWQPAYTLNGKAFSTVAILTQTTNTFVGQPIKELSNGAMGGNSALVISNLDTSNQVTVSDCFANPSVGN